MERGEAGRYLEVEEGETMRLGGRTFCSRAGMGRSSPVRTS